jgi:hypothetical protein
MDTGGSLDRLRWLFYLFFIFPGHAEMQSNFWILSFQCVNRSRNDLCNLVYGAMLSMVESIKYRTHMKKKQVCMVKHNLSTLSVIM